METIRPAAGAGYLQRQGESAFVAVVEAGILRFRPILLTTFCGLMPKIFETSRQARFLIPMAISLGFGIIFATVNALLPVPCLYLILEDFRRLLWRAEEDKKKSLESAFLEQGGVWLNLDNCMLIYLNEPWLVYC